MKSNVEEKFAVGETQLHAVKGPIARAAEAEELEKSSGVSKLPESLFISNSLEITTPVFVLRFCTRDAVHMLSPAMLGASRTAREKSNVTERWKHVEFAFDEPVQVPVATLWAHKRQTTPGLEQAADGDWLFLNYYSGGFFPKGEWVAAPSKEGIPASRLTRANTVLWFQDLYLYESDLDDWGYSFLRLKLRVQEDSVFALLRSYARVDQAQIRILETRFFIDFIDWSIVRRVEAYNASYSEIRIAGFTFDSGFNIDHEQADRVMPFLRRVFESTWRFSPKSAASAIN